MAQLAYWKSRGPQFQASRWKSIAKNSPALRPILNGLLSLRVADEAFIATALANSGGRVLDLGAGAGLDVVAKMDHAIGIDIPGAPGNAALQRGYKEYFYYGDSKAISLEQKVDTIVCRNLNAHIPFQLFSSLLSDSLAYLKAGGMVILLNEYDNSGLSYRMMKRRSHSQWQRMVNGMDHEFFEREAAFMSKLDAADLPLDLLSRQPIIGGILPSLHYMAYSRVMIGPSRARTLLTLLLDLPLSVANKLQTSFTECRNGAFLVGYVFRKR